MKSLVLIDAGLLSATIAFVTNWLALIPWRRAKDRHWSERARLYFPVRVAAASNLWVLPAVLTISGVLVWPEESPHWMLLALITASGAVVGTIPMDREVFPHIPRRELFRQAAVNWLIRFLLWFVFLTAITLMPDQFSIQTGVIAASVLALCIFWSHDGWIRVGRKIGLFVPPTERLLCIVRETAARVNVPVRDVCLMRISIAQAFAAPAGRRLLFSERLVELLSDDEISATATHELAHLTEVRADYYKRYVIWLMFLPWLLFKPLLHTFGPTGFFMLLGTTVVAPILYRSVCRKLEIRADKVAHMNEPASGTYARALLRLHEDSLVPAVHAKQHGTHPHLYDRLLAAGIQPDFPRPPPAKAMAWNGVLFSAALGIVAMLLIIRLTGGF